MFEEKKFLSEAFGTFWLVIGGCGAAVLSAAQPEGGIGLLGVAVAFGLAVLTMVYVFGAISGAHLNPAVTIGAAMAGRVGWGEVPSYIVAQLVGAVCASCLLALIVSGRAGGDIAGGMLAANGFGAHSPAGYSAAICFLVEFILAFTFVTIVLGVTRDQTQRAVAPLAIGLALTLVHLVSLPITNTSLNPARSTGPALVMYALREEWPLGQLWMFWLAPIAGGSLAGLFTRWMFRTKPEQSAACVRANICVQQSACQKPVATQRCGS